MSEQALAQKARKHWERWLPQKVAELKQQGTFSEATQAAGKLAQARISELMATGFREHEAEEVALSEFVLLQPEPAAVAPAWEQEELAKLDREYRKLMR